MTNREKWKNKLKLVEEYVERCIDADKSTLFTDKIEEKLGITLTACRDYMNAVCLRDDIKEGANLKLKRFVINFNALFLSACASNKLKKKHLKKLFKLALKHFNKQPVTDIKYYCII